MDSATLSKKMATYNAKPVTSTDALNEALGKYGVPEIRNTVDGLRTTVANTTNSLNAVDPSVTGRTSGSLVTEAQRQRQVANERAPIAQNLTDESNALNQNQQTLQDALGMATTQASNKVNDYNAGRDALKGEYEMAYNREQDSSAKKAAKLAASENTRQFNVREAEDKRQFNISSGQSQQRINNSGSKKPAKMSQKEVTAAIRQGLESVKGKDKHVAPQDLARAYQDWLSSGLSVSAFWKNFQGYWNPKQGNYQQQFDAAR